MKRFGQVLIVSVAVMVLAMLIYPLTVPARGGDEFTAACMSNLKQNSVSMLLYANDYNERFPNRSQWMDTMLPYTKNEGVYHCPSVIRAGDWSNKTPRLHGYAFNSRESEAKISDDLAKTPLVYESTNLSRNASDPFLSLGGWDRHKRGRIALAYGDSHVKALRRDERP